MPEEIVKQKQLFRRFETPVLQMRKEEDAYVLSFPASSETPVERWYGEEVLVHTTKAFNARRAGPCRCSSTMTWTIRLAW